MSTMTFPVNIDAMEVAERKRLAVELARLVFSPYPWALLEVEIRGVDAEGANPLAYTVDEAGVDAWECLNEEHKREALWRLLQYCYSANKVNRFRLAGKIAQASGIEKRLDSLYESLPPALQW